MRQRHRTAAATEILSFSNWRRQRSSSTRAAQFQHSACSSAAVSTSFSFNVQQATAPALQQRSFNDNGNSAVRLYSAVIHRPRQRQQHLLRSVSIRRQQPCQLQRSAYTSVSATALASCNDGSNSSNFNVQRQQRLHSSGSSIQRRRAASPSASATTTSAVLHIRHRQPCSISAAPTTALFLLQQHRRRR